MTSMRGFAKVVVVEEHTHGMHDPLQSGLHALGLEGVSTCLQDSQDMMGNGQKPDAVMIRLPEAKGQITHQQAIFAPYLELARALKSTPSTEQIPVIIVGSDRAIAQCEQVRHRIDDLLPLYDLEVRLPERLRAALRLKTLSEEYTRRHLSLREFGCELDITTRATLSPFRFLIAQSDDQYCPLTTHKMDWDHANVHVKVCTIADMDQSIIEYEPDALFVHVSQYVELAGSKLRTICAIRDYATLPIVLLHPEGKAYSVFGSKPLPAGIELASENLAPNALIELVLARSKEHRLRRWLSTDIRTLSHPSVIDHATDLFTSAFFSRHLGRVIAQTERHNGCLTMAMIALPELPQSECVHILKQVGQIVKNQTRAEDILAHLGQGIVCIVFLGTVSLDAVSALSRIEKILNALIEPIKMWPETKVTASIIEHDKNEKVLSFISRAQAVLV